MVAWPHSKCFARLLFLAVLLLPAAASAQFDTAQVSGSSRTAAAACFQASTSCSSPRYRIERRAVTNEAGVWTFPTFRWATIASTQRCPGSSQREKPACA